jgi:CDGSH-type Zn-finger protein
MSQPPLTVQMDAGTHWLCTCGLSANYPLCNGSHKGTEFQPNPLELAAPETVNIPAPGEFSIQD